VDQASLISAVDLLPTFCEIAGVEISENYAPDGMSMVSVLMGDPMPSRMKPLFWKAQSAWPAPEDRPDHWVSWAIVQETWKLVANGNLDHVELYRIDADLSESTNVAESQSGTVQILLGMTKDWQNTLPEEPDGDVFSTERALV